MPPLKFTEVLSFSSEDPSHPVENLLRPDTFRKWKCASGTSEKQASVIVKLERLTSIHSIDIGNEGSAFVEVLVAREGGDFQVLLVASSFMTPSESRNGSNLSRVRMFGSDKLNKIVADQKWDRLKVICTQPFNKNMQYGLSFINVTAPSEGASDSTPKTIKLGSFTLKEEESDSISIGSMFARRKESETSSPLTGAAAIRAASASAASTISASPIVETKKPFNAPDVGFYQLKKEDKESPKNPNSSKQNESSSDSLPNRKHSDKHRDKGDKQNNHDDKHREAQRKRDRDEKEERSKNKHRKDKNQERSQRTESEKKKEDSRTSQKKHQQDDEKHPTSSKKKSAPFSALLKDVNFVLSGYQNPQRSQIRDMMIEMGARYKPVWGPSCTHLICAFSNTPKYQQVKGKGRIVSAKWTFECHKSKIRYPTKRYALEKQRNTDDSEEEIWAEELLPKEEKPSPKTVKPDSRQGVSDNEDNDSDKTYSDNENTDDEIERALVKQKLKANSPDESSSKLKDIKDETPSSKKRKLEEADGDEKPAQNLNRKSNGINNTKKDMNGTEDNIYDEDTDIDEENMVHVTRPDTSSLPLPSLGDYLNGKYFYIYGNMPAEMKKLLSRYIIAFDGILENYMTDKVNFVLTEDEWDDNFEEALSENSSVQFVKPSWIWRCSDKQKLVPFQPHLVVPKE